MNFSASEIRRISNSAFPTKLSLLFLDRQVVDAGETAFHVAALVKLPILVAVGTIPLAGIVAPFVLETHRDAVVAERPQLFLQTIVQFFVPFAPEEFDDLGATVKELRSVAPFGVLRVGERDPLGIAAVSGVFGSLNFLAGGFLGEWRERRTRVHVSFDFSIWPPVRRCVV